MSEPTQENSRELHYLARSLLLAIPAISIGIQISTWIFVALGDHKNRVDFFAYYEAGYLLRTGQVSRFYHQIQPPSFGFIHPAYEALLFVPLSFLAPRIAYLVWIFVGLVVVGLILRILRNEVAFLKSLSPVMPWALTLAFFPVPYALAQGQDSLLLALLIVLAFKQIKSRTDFFAGVLLGLGVFRFQILVPMAVMFLFWRWWRLLGGMIISAAVALCASLVITGISGQMQYFRLLRLLSNPSNQNLQEMTNLRGVLAAVGVISPHIVLAFSSVLLVTLAWVGHKSARCDSFLFAIAASCLLSYHLFLHDVSLLLPPLLIIADLSVKRADYWGLSSAGVIMLLPEAAIIAGSATALWICALMPLLVMLILRTRARQFSPVTAVRG